MDPQTLNRHLRAMFDRTASRYVEFIDPAFAPLASSLVERAAPQPGERVLDLGTGSGLVALAAGPHAARVVGLDLSLPLLHVANSKLDASMPKVAFTQGDMHALPFAEGTFDLVLAAFSVHSTDPWQSLYEAHRVLAPRGRLAMLEWGVSDPLSQIVYDTLDEYALEDPPAPLAAMREAMSTPGPWDDLDGLDDLQVLLETTGFTDVTLQQEEYGVGFKTVGSFVSYKMAWASRAEELDALPSEMRRLFWSEIRENLQPHASSDGGLTWHPSIVLISAIKSLV